MEDNGMSLRLELQNCEKKFQEIESVLSHQSAERDGAFEFSYYKLKKQKNEIHDRICHISQLLTPDIIA